ncbi:hypothetical protein ACIBG7_37800 [Nonomuraea sp. NPDC050328]|uniref:hypothetical protein n=1 Tax=Nonomuraea sp. NPDC050328 TaxID=3364361 RepID=UPI0037AE3EF6
MERHAPGGRGVKIRKRAPRPKQRIDVGRLPEEVVALIDALGPGETLVITRDEASIATVASTVAVVEGAVVGLEAAAETAPEEEPVKLDGVTVVATAMELSRAARVALSDQLGDDYVVLDLHAAPKTTDVLLVPAGSPQLIGALRAMFPKARVIITEIEDDELGVQYHGPVRRLLDAGADAYLPPASLPMLARQLDYTLTQGRELAAGRGTPLQLTPAAEPEDAADRPGGGAGA